MARTPWPLTRRRAGILADAACDVLDVAADAAGRTGLASEQAQHFVVAVLMSALQGWSEVGDETKKEAAQLQQDWARDL